MWVEGRVERLSGWWQTWLCGPGRSGDRPPGVSSGLRYILSLGVCGLIAGGRNLQGPAQWWLSALLPAARLSALINP